MNRRPFFHFLTHPDIEKGNHGNRTIVVGSAKSRWTIIPSKAQTSWALLISSLAFVIRVTNAQTLNPSNGHYYLKVDAGVTWSTAASQAASSNYLGMTGHLATITSQSEQDFIVNNLFPADPGFVAYWLGGFQPAGSQEPAGGWQWVTGEAWSFTAWNTLTSNEPNNSGNEDALHLFFGGSVRGLWNDFPSGSSDVFGAPLGYIVEFEASGGQTDNFNVGNDSAWMHTNLNATFGQQLSTYSFPNDALGGKAYRILSLAPPNNSAGNARAISFRTNVYSDFQVAVDLVAWDSSLNQAFGLVARLKYRLRPVLRLGLFFYLFLGFHARAPDLPDYRSSCDRDRQHIHNARFDAQV